MHQVIAGLSACQGTVEKLLESVKSSNERIEELTDRDKALESEMKTGHAQIADRSTSGGGRRAKRKRSPSSLVVQVSMLLFYYYLATYMHLW